MGLDILIDSDITLHSILRVYVRTSILGHVLCVRTYVLGHVYMSYMVGHVYMSFMFGKVRMLEHGGITLCVLHGRQAIMGINITA
jgi:hypothetical protein